MKMNHVDQSTFERSLFLLNNSLTEWGNAVSLALEDYCDATIVAERRCLEATVACYLTFLSKWLVSGEIFLKDEKVVSIATPSQVNLRDLYYRLRRLGFPHDLCVFVLDLHESKDTGCVPNSLGVALLQHMNIKNAATVCYLVRCLWREEYRFLYEEGHREPFTLRALLNAEQRQFFRNGYLLTDHEQCELVKRNWFSSAFLQMPDEAKDTKVIELCVSLNKTESPLEVIRLSTTLAVSLNVAIPFIYQAYQQVLAA